LAVLALLAALCVPLSGCGSGLVGRDSVPAGRAGFQPANESQAGTPAPPEQDAAGPLPIPSPAQIYAQLHGAKQASSLLTRDASDFVPTFSHRVTTIEPDAIYSPDWANGYSSFDTIAFAIYRFDLTARTGRLLINTQWPQRPKDYKLLWLGASNWEKNRWEWYSGAPSGVARTSAGSLDRYRHPDTGEMYVAVVLLGQTSGLLRKVWLTCSKHGDWWMYGRNATHHSCSPFKGPDNPAVLWQCSLGVGANFCSPVYDSDGTIYVGAYIQFAPTCDFYALNADGSQKWTQPLTESTGPSSTRSAAIDDNGTIYYAESSGVLYALNPDGTQKWVSAGHRAVSLSPAIGPEGTIYVTGHEDSDSSEWYLYALNKDGALRWKYCFGDGESASSPAVAPDGTVYVCRDDGKLYAFKPDGATKWTYQAGGATYGNEVSVGRNGTVYFPTMESKLYALNPDGTLAWCYQFADFAGTPVSSGLDGAVYVRCGDGFLYVLNADGTLRWSFRVGQRTAEPAVDAGGTVYVGSMDSRLYAINSDGTLKWWFTASNGIGTSPVIAEDGTVYVFDMNGMFYAIGPGSQMEGHTASGRVTDAGGVGIPGVKITITGEEPAFTDGNGYWSKSGLTDGAYLVSPTKQGYGFSPLFDAVDVSGADVSVADFTGGAQGPPVWPMWGLNRAHTRRSPYAGPAEPTLEWSVWCNNESVKSEPMIGGDGVIYVQCALGTLYAFNPDGTQRWKIAFGTPSQASPAIALDGTVYTNITTGTDPHIIYAYTPGGVYDWSYACPADGSPVIAADGAIVSTGGASGVFVLDPNGTLRWSFESGASGPSDATPAIAGDGTLYTRGGADTILALDPDGTQKWAFAAASGGAEFTPLCSAAVGGDGTVYIGVGANFYALNPDGTQQWVYNTGTYCFSSPAIGAGGTVYTGATDVGSMPECKFIALNPDGTLQWEHPAIASVLSSPAVDANGVIYVGIIVGAASGSLCAFNPDGSVKWTYNTHGAVNGNPSISADGTLYFGDEAGYVYALGPGGG
jgi:outer membrane protein assembly factor BamB